MQMPRIIIATYSKSAWLCWCAAGDWYDKVTGKYEHFIGRSVQGGIYMPIFRMYLKRLEK